MPSEQGLENGKALMAMGWVCVLFALLVFFFNPAALKLGDVRIAVISGSLVVAGIILSVAGARVRARSR